MSDAQIDDIVKCPECMSRRLENDTVRGENVCLDCGLVVESNTIDPLAEWRVYDMTQNGRQRTGPAATNLLHDKGLSTEMDWQNKDYAGNTVKNRSQLYRMRKWQRRSRVRGSKDRNLAIALAELDRMCSQLEMPKQIREQAALIYRKALDNKVCRGRSIEAVVAASVYIGCRVCNVPRTLDEVCVAARTGRKEIGRTARFMVRELKMKVNPPRARDFTARFCSLLGLPPEVEAQANEFIQEIEDKELDSGRGPVGLAASCIYVSSVMQEHRRTQKEVAKVAGVTEVTIRNRYKEIVDHLQLDVVV